MTLPTKVIIFDFGNVLLNWDPRGPYQRFFPEGPQAVDAFLAEIEFMDWNREQDRGRSFADAVAERSAKFPQYAHIIPAYDIHYEDSIVGPIEGTVEILRRLKDGGVPLYGLSNYSTEKFQVVREKYVFFNWFDDILISAAVGLVKPDPAIFRLLLTKIGRSAEECIFIDDSSANIVAAQGLGFTAIQFHSPEQLEQELGILGIL
jgi:2-haloacid dehalogenase